MPHVVVLVRTWITIVADLVPVLAFAATRSPTLQLTCWPDGAEQLPDVDVGVPTIESPAGMSSVTVTAVAVMPPVLVTTRGESQESPAVAPGGGAGVGSVTLGVGAACTDAAD